jgi:hypothetical protein
VKCRESRLGRVGKVGRSSKPSDFLAGQVNARDRVWRVDKFGSWDKSRRFCHISEGSITVLLTD